VQDSRVIAVDARPANYFRRVRWPLVAGLLLFLCSLVLRGLRPVIVRQAGYDDALFVRLADSLRSGHWLGTYDSLTLAKGPAYPTLLALTSWFQVPIKPVEQLIYLSGSALISALVARSTGRDWLGVALFALLALNPIMFSDSLATLSREGLYAGLPFLVFAAIAWLLTGPGTRGSQVAAGLGVGVIFAVYWLTREEGAWLLPTLGLVAVFGLARAYVRGQPMRSTAADAIGSGVHSELRRRTESMLAIAVGAQSVLFGVALANLVAYGVPLVNDFRDGSFPAAYGAFTRGYVSDSQRSVVAPAATRQAIYSASASAAELASWLEGPAEQSWLRPGCTARTLSADPSLLPPTCDDFYDGWFQWALRDAAAKSGHWSTASAAQAFFSQLATEVDIACRDGRLICRPRDDSLGPAFRLEYLGEGMKLLPYAVGRLINGEGIGPNFSFGDEAYLLHAAQLANSDIQSPRPAPHMKLVGWVAARAAVPSLLLNPGATGTGTFTMTTKPGHDVEAFFAARGELDWKAVRFIVETDCTAPTCNLVIHAPGIVDATIPIGELTVEGKRSYAFPNSPQPSGENLRFHLERTEYDPAFVAGPIREVIGARPDIVTNAIIALRSFYGFMLPIALVFAVIGFVFHLLSPARSRNWLLVVVTLACGVAVVARVGSLIVLELASWPGPLSSAYIYPASPFLLTIVALGLYLGRSSLRAHLHIDEASHSDVVSDGAAKPLGPMREVGHLSLQAVTAQVSRALRDHAAATKARASRGIPVRQSRDN
jgi:hypothetical protein